MSHSPSEGSSSDQDDFDDYADLDDYDDGEMYTKDSDEEEGHMSSETNLEMIIDVEAVKEKFEHLPSKPEVGVAHVHGDVISLYLPFYSYLNKGHQLAWKEYEHSYIVMDLKVDITAYRQAKTLSVVSTVLSCGTTAPPLQLFCDHLRTIAQSYIQENYKNSEKNVLSGLFEELLGRIENLSNFCCFCDKRLGDEGAFFSTFCSSSLCSFQGEEFLRAHPKARGSARVFYNVLKLSEHFKSMKYSHQALILHESPDQVADFEKRCRLKGARILFYDNKHDDWLDFMRRENWTSPIPVSRQPFNDLYRQEAKNWVLCEVVEDPSTLIQVTHNDYNVWDLRSMRFRVDLKNGEGSSSQLSIEDEVQLRNQLSILQEHGQPEIEERFELGNLPTNVLLQVLQLSSRQDANRLGQASKKFHSIIQAQKKYLRTFKDVRLNISHRENCEAKIRVENILDKSIVEVFVDLSVPKDSPADVSEEDQNAQGEEVMGPDQQLAVKKPMFDNFTVVGGMEDAWKAVKIHVEGRSLKEVVARLAEMMQITSVEINKASLDDADDLLKALPALRELHIPGFEYKKRPANKENNFVRNLPRDLNSLSVESSFLQKTDRGILPFSLPRLHHLEQLHIYGGGDMTNETFQALEVRRLCLDDMVITLEALFQVVKEWKEGEREIEVMSIPVVENPAAPGQQPQPHRYFPSSSATKEQILQALQLDADTSKLRRIGDDAELKVKIFPKTLRYGCKDLCVQLVSA